MGAVLEENYFPWNSFSFLEATEMKVDQRTVDLYRVQILHCYTVGSTSLDFLKPTGMLQFSRTINKTEVKPVAGKYPQCQCRMLQSFHGTSKLA